MNLTDAYCHTCWIGGKCHCKVDCDKFHEPLAIDITWPTAQQIKTVNVKVEEEAA